MFEPLWLDRRKQSPVARNRLCQRDLFFSPQTTEINEDPYSRYSHRRERERFKLRLIAKSNKKTNKTASLTGSVLSIENGN